jgi:predicted DNA-binding transcriptional regulator AlpA
MKEKEVLVTEDKVEELLKKSKNERLLIQIDEGVINPIELAKFLGIAPQQIYNRIKQGKIATVDRNTTQKIVIPLWAATKFAAEYLDKQAQKQKRIDDELKGIK